MKTIFIILLVCFGSPLFSQKIEFKQKIKIRKELKKMLELDQKYRVRITNEHNQKTIDSLWILQTKYDFQNKIQLVNMIRKNGYPAAKRLGLYAKETTAIITLHLVNDYDFHELKDIFYDELKAGNMPSLEYARWYDRSQFTMKLPVKYGAYTRESFCGLRLDEINSNRMEIGLTPLAASTNCN